MNRYEINDGHFSKTQHNDARRELVIVHSQLATQHLSAEARGIAGRSTTS